VTNQCFVTPPKIGKYETPVVQDLAKAFDHAQGSVSFFSSRIGIERLFVQAHILEASAPILLY
jgi:hypothetical protein